MVITTVRGSVTSIAVARSSDRTVGLSEALRSSEALPAAASSGVPFQKRTPSRILSSHRNRSSDRQLVASHGSCSPLRLTRMSISPMPHFRKSNALVAGSSDLMPNDSTRTMGFPDVLGSSAGEDAAGCRAGPQATAKPVAPAAINV